MVNMSNKQIIGIYCIHNKRNNKRYIGRSLNINRRFTGHYSSLTGGTHGNFYLQSEWDLYGEGCFEFIILEQCEPEQLMELEEKYITLYSSTIDKHGYNLTLGGDDTKHIKIMDNIKVPLKHFGYNEVFLDDVDNSYYMRTKQVECNNNQGYITLPKHWIGKKVRVLLLENIE